MGSFKAVASPVVPTLMRSEPEDNVHFPCAHACTVRSKHFCYVCVIFFSLVAYIVAFCFVIEMIRRVASIFVQNCSTHSSWPQWTDARNKPQIYGYRQLYYITVMSAYA